MGDNKSRLFYTCGLPRSGKSTLAKRWAAERHWMTDGGTERRDDGDTLTYKFSGPAYLRLPSRPRAVLSGDEFRLAVSGSHYNLSSEGFVFAAMDAAARALLSSGHDVMIDETCTTEQTLLRYLLIDIDATPVFVNTPVSVCEERAITSGREYLVPVIRKLSPQFEHFRDNFDEVHARAKGRVLDRYRSLGSSCHPLSAVS